MVSFLSTNFINNVYCTTADNKIDYTCIYLSKKIFKNIVMTNLKTTHFRRCNDITNISQLRHKSITMTSQTQPATVVLFLADRCLGVVRVANIVRCINALEMCVRRRMLSISWTNTWIRGRSVHAGVCN